MIARGLLTVQVGMIGAIAMVPTLDRCPIRATPSGEIRIAAMARFHGLSHGGFRLSPSQRATLRYWGRHLVSQPVNEVASAAAGISAMLENELVKVSFPTSTRKQEAFELAEDLAWNTGADVVECVEDECLLYRPSAGHQGPANARPVYPV